MILIAVVQTYEETVRQRVRHLIKQIEDETVRKALSKDYDNRIEQESS